MCGILFSKRFDGKLARKLINKRYQTQKTRGQEGFGFVEIQNGIVGQEFRSEEEKDIETCLKGSEAEEILFHHRFPTSTPNFVEATHPIRVSNKILKYDYYVVHNGIISNDSELKQKHNVMGFKYTTEMSKTYTTRGNVYEESMWNDSEALAIDFALAVETGKKMEAKGSIAIVALQFDKKTKKAVALYYGRNLGSPLKQEFNDAFLCLSSETGTLLMQNILFKFDYMTNTITESDMDIGIFNDYVYPSSGYNFHNDYKGVYDDVKDVGFDWGSRNKNKLRVKDDEYYEKMTKMYNDIADIKKDIEESKLQGDYDSQVEQEMELEDLEIEMNTLYDDDYE